MPQMDNLVAALNSLRVGLANAANEDDIERLFNSLYEGLGYSLVGIDILGKRAGRSGIPDVRLLNNDERIHVVVELKAPHENLIDHENQLVRYVRDLRSDYGLLTNGHQFRIYQRRGLAIDLLHERSIEGLLEDPSLLEPLEKRDVEYLDVAQVRNSLNQAVEDLMKLEGMDSLPVQQFLGSFDLNPRSAFGGLVVSVRQVLEELLDTSPFASGAYDFWKKTYAREVATDEAPRVWHSFGGLSNREQVYRFMYSLETAYILSARLILAKAIQDHDSDGALTANHLAGRFHRDLEQEADDRTGMLKPDAYLKVTQGLFNRYATSLFTSIYGQDLFDWWRDYELATEESRANFGYSVARLVLGLVRFDFSGLEGDLLGELYQTYFDADTRKALGEFYTPPEVVNFILNRVGYTGNRHSRLLDPATGSGTFLIGALQRYLAANADRDPVNTLNGITKEFRLVAFDVNPFAVLMAQINVAAMLVPLYARAVKQDPQLVLRRLPIVRTDSLRQEVLEGEQRLGGVRHEVGGNSNQAVGFDFGASEITAQIELPVRDPHSGGEPLSVSVTFPALDVARNEGRVQNEREWLLALQSVFSSVERLSQAYDTGLRENQLPDLGDVLYEELAHFQATPDVLVEYLRPYAEGIWKTLQLLKDNYGDGRFLKTLEDLTLGLILKHYLQYDFVVGNPPYVRVQNLPNVLKKYWQDRYMWAQGNFDIFIPFVERAVSTERPWLRNGGRVGYILPNRFLNANYAAGLREAFPKVARVSAIVDFKSATFSVEGDRAARLFSEAMVYPAIVIAEKSDKPVDYSFMAARFYPREAPLKPAEAIRQLETTLDEGQPHVRKAHGSREYLDVFVQDCSVLRGDGWYLMPAAERTIFDQLLDLGETEDPRLLGRTLEERKRILSNYTATESGGFAGLQTSLDSVLVVKQIRTDASKGLALVRPRGGGDEVWLEQAALRPFLFGRDVRRWRIDFEEWFVLFPYFKDSGKYRFLPSTDYWEFELSEGRTASRVFGGYSPSAPRIDSLFPHAWAYLKANETALRAREGGRFQEGRRDEWRWYDLGYPRSLEAFDQPKVVLQVTTNRSSFAFDRDCYYFTAGGTSGVYGLLPISGVPIELFAAIGNSRVAEYYVKHVSSPFGNGYYSYGDQFIKGIPIPNLDGPGEGAVIEIAKKLTQKTAALSELNKSISDFPNSVTSLRRQSGTVPDLDTIARQGTGYRQFAQRIDSERVTLQSTILGQVEVQAGRGRIVLDPSAAKLVKELIDIRGTVGRDELLNQAIPVDDSECEAFLACLEGWRSTTNALERDIAMLEADLDDLLLQAYDISGSQGTVITEFLERF